MSYSPGTTSRSSTLNGQGLLESLEQRIIDTRVTTGDRPYFTVSINAMS